MMGKSFRKITEFYARFKDPFLFFYKTVDKSMGENLLYVKFAFLKRYFLLFLILWFCFKNVCLFFSFQVDILLNFFHPIFFFAYLIYGFGLILEFSFRLYFLRRLIIYSNNSSFFFRFASFFFFLFYLISVVSGIVIIIFMLCSLLDIFIMSNIAVYDIKGLKHTGSFIDSIITYLSGRLTNTQLISEILNPTLGAQRRALEANLFYSKKDT